MTTGRTTGEQAANNVRPSSPPSSLQKISDTILIPKKIIFRDYPIYLALSPRKALKPDGLEPFSAAVNRNPKLIITPSLLPPHWDCSAKGYPTAVYISSTGDHIKYLWYRQKKLPVYVYLFSLTIFGPIYYGPP